MKHTYNIMMRNLIALATLMVFAITAQAQNGGGTYKPTAGNITTEVLFNDFGDISLNNGLLRGRYFMSDATALRLSVGINYDYRKLDDDAHYRTSGIALAPGIEKHFAGTDRLSPYIGAELPIRFTGARYENENVEVKGATGTNGSDRAYFSVGLNAVAGTDFYFARNFYAGVEVGVGLRYRKDAEVEVDTDFGNNTTVEGFHGVDFSQFVNGGVRVGFVF
nr:OmpA family protein [Pontibacter actiniarum]